MPVVAHVRPQTPQQAALARWRHDMDRAAEALSLVRDLASGVWAHKWQILYARVFYIIVELSPAAMDWFVTRASMLSRSARAILLEIYPLY